MMTVVVRTWLQGGAVLDPEGGLLQKVVFYHIIWALYGAAQISCLDLSTHSSLTVACGEAVVKWKEIKAESSIHLQV